MRPLLMPRLIVIAGPNGAGKTTSAPTLLRDHFKIADFVNADTIASGLSAFAPENMALPAGRIMLKQLKQLRQSGQDFAFETTLSALGYVPWLRSCQKEGYEVSLLFLALPSPELAIARVAERVRAGGHYVPDDIVRRRFRRGLGNFSRHYRALADKWFLVDNSKVLEPRLVASGGLALPLVVNWPERYRHLEMLCEG